MFDETVSPAIDEAAKPIPEIMPLPPGDAPPADPNRPKPPTDPIADADPRKSRSYTLASAFNRIWAILLKGKDTAQAIEGWHKTYDALKPHWTNHRILAPLLAERSVESRSMFDRRLTVTPKRTT